MSKGFIKLNREAEVLLETDPNAFLLMCQIAFRAKWKDNKLDMSKTNLGEALVGDFDKCGLTEKAYRLAKSRLEFRKIAAFKGTNKGTIAKLLDNSFCDINLNDEGEQKGEQKDIPRADKGRTKGEPGATKEEVKKERIKEPTSAAPAPQVVMTKELIGSGLANLGIGKVESDKLFKTWGYEIVFLAYQHITADGFVIETTPIQAIKFACKNKPWEWKTAKPSAESHYKKFIKHFPDGSVHNGYTCQVNSKGFTFYAGTTCDGVQFDNPKYQANLSRVLKRFGIENTTQVEIINIKEA